MAILHQPKRSISETTGPSFVCFADPSFSSSKGLEVMESKIRSSMDQHRSSLWQVTPKKEPPNPKPVNPCHQTSTNIGLAGLALEPLEPTAVCVCPNIGPNATHVSRPATSPGR